MLDKKIELRVHYSRAVILSAVRVYAKNYQRLELWLSASSTWACSGVDDACGGGAAAFALVLELVKSFWSCGDACVHRN